MMIDTSRWDGWTRLWIAGSAAWLTYSIFTTPLPDEFDIRLSLGKRMWDEGAMTLAMAQAYASLAAFVFGPPALAYLTLKGANWIVRGFSPSKAANTSTNFQPAVSPKHSMKNLTRKDRPISRVARTLITIAFAIFVSYLLIKAGSSKDHNIIYLFFESIPSAVIVSFVVLIFVRPEISISPWKECCWTALLLGMLSAGRVQHLSSIGGVTMMAGAIGILFILYLRRKT